jgi:GTP cyclohydrolase FolE2
VANRNAHRFKYILAAHIVQNSMFVDDVIRTASMTLAGDKVTPLC